MSSAATSRHLDGTGHVCSVGRRENFQRRCGHISKNEIHPSFVKKLQTYMKGNRQTLKVLSASSPGARDREGHSSCVAMKTKEATLVANVKHYAMMRAIQDEEYQELHEIIECMNERRERLMSTMKRKQKLMGDVPALHEKLHHDMMVLDDRIWAEEVEPREKKQAMKELLKERRRTEVEGWRDANGSQSFEAEVDHFEVSEVVLHRSQESFGHVAEKESCGAQRVCRNTGLCVGTSAGERP